MLKEKLIFTSIFIGLLSTSIFANPYAKQDNSKSIAKKNSQKILLPSNRVNKEKQANIAGFSSGEIQKMDKFIEKNIKNLISVNSKKSIRNFQRHSKMCISKKDTKEGVNKCTKGLYKYYYYQIKRQKTNQYGWDTRPIKKSQ